MKTTVQLTRSQHGNHFRAFSLRGEKPELIDPFLGVDHAWLGGPTFPPHPHSGFSAVSYVFLDAETGIDNRDALGNQNIIQPGGLHWLAAGRGIVHEEVPAQVGKTVHMLQIFINLEVKKQDAAPFTLSLAPADVPTVELLGVKIRVLLGQFGEVTSPLKPPTEVNLLDISLKNEVEVDVPISIRHNAFIMPIFGSVEIDGQHFDSDAGRLSIFKGLETTRSIALKAVEGEAKVVVFTGIPLNQPVYWHGPMALASPEKLSEAIIAYQNGEFGSLK